MNSMDAFNRLLMRPAKQEAIDGHIGCRSCETLNKDRHRRRINSRCQSCGAIRCQRHLYSWVDGSNESITKHAPLMCRACYSAQYEPAKTEEQAS